MAAVAETAGSRIETVFGNKKVVIADLTSVDDTDTWNSLLTTIEWVFFVATTAAHPGITVSGGTATFVTATALAGKIMAIGI